MTKSKFPRVGIFVPCYNEYENIKNIVDRVIKYKIENQNSFEVILIIVDDGSNDGTSEVLANLPVDAIYQLSVNQGLGAATRIGMEIADYLDCDVFAKLDADGQHVIEDFNEPIELILNGKADIVYASRFRGKIHYKMPLYRYLGNLFFTRLMRFVTGWKITDAQTGIMVFSSRYLDVFEMPSTYNPPQQALFDASRKGMRFSETEAHFYPREKGQSFVSFKYIPKVFSSLLKLSFYFYSYRLIFVYSLLSISIGISVFALDAIQYLYADSGTYLENGTTVLVTLTTGILSFLLGLQGYAIMTRQSYVRNGDYKYFSKRLLVIRNKQLDLRIRDK